MGRRLGGEMLRKHEDLRGGPEFWSLAISLEKVKCEGAPLKAQDWEAETGGYLGVGGQPI